MANFFGISGSMFSNNASTNWTSNLTSVLSDYSSIRSGSYYKLLKNYYSKDENKSSAAKDLMSSSDKTANKELTQAKASADELKSSAEALTAKGTKSLFTKKNITTKDENGKETTVLDYDRDAITKAVKSFAENYNSLVESSADVTDTSVLSKTLQMTKTTLANKNLLSDVGITISGGNKLTVDEEKLKTADINSLKTLFNGTNSYADKIAQKASQISTAASQSASKSSGLYNSSGSYYNYSGVFNEYY